MVEVEVTMMMTVERASDTIRAEMTLSGDHKVRLGVRPFLSFFEKYQTAEDDSVEMKMVKGLDTLGKMNYIGATVLSTVTVEFMDQERCAENLSVRMSHIEASIQKRPEDRGDCKPDMKVRFVKTMRGKVGLVQVSQSVRRPSRYTFALGNMRPDDLYDTPESSFHIIISNH